MITFDDALPYLFFSIIVFIISVRLYGLLPFPTGIAAWAVLSQFLFTMTAAGYYDYQFLAVFYRGGLFSRYDFTMGLFCAISAFSVAAFIGGQRISSRRIVSTLASAGAWRDSGLTKVAVILFTVCTTHILLLFLLVDTDFIWFHTHYLTLDLSEDVAYAFGSLTSFILKSTVVLYILAPVTFVLAVRARQRGLAKLAFLEMSIVFIFAISTNTRASVFVPVALGLGYYIFSLRGRGWIIPSCAIFAIYALMNGLVGRGSPIQGISGIPHVFGLMIDRFSSSFFLDILVNFCEGIFVVAEGDLVNADFSTRYSTLSFSPLPSFIDGFSEILATDQVRLHGFVPMAGYTESYKFGLGGIVVGFIIFVIAARLCVRLSRAPSATFLLCNFLLFFSIHNLAAYPIRSAFRYLWLSILLGIWGVSYARKAYGRSSALFEVGHRAAAQNSRT